MGESVSKTFILTGAAREQEIFAQEVEGKRLASLGYWAGQLGAVEESSARPRLGRRSKKAAPGRVALTWGVAHRLYLARKGKGWSAGRAAQAFGLGTSTYCNYERSSLNGADASAPLTVVRKQSVNPWAINIPCALLHKAARIYNCDYFEEAANANA